MANSGNGPLARSLSTRDAIAIGLGSMIGAGVFAAFAPAAAAAGSGLLIGLAIAAGVAYCNATSSAQLAASYPTSGGTYVYGRERLGDWWGFLAGWGFVVGKMASCAAMAMTFAAYVAPDGWERPFAVAAVVALTMTNYGGVTRTARLTRIIVALVVTGLAVTVAAAMTCTPSDPAFGSPTQLFDDGWYGILQSAGLLFFAFAGYARVATLGEEVRNPARSIPRAIVAALMITVVIYAIVATTVLSVLGPDTLSTSTEPLADAVAAGSWTWASPIVRAAAAIAALGALLALIAGVGRTTLAMARNRDLPAWLAAVHAKNQVPYHAEIAVAVIVCTVVLFVDLRGAIGFSSFGVLLYYFVANVAAWTQPREQRRYPRAVQVVGAAACLVLVTTLPWPAVLGGVLVFAAGIAYRLARLQLART